MFKHCNYLLGLLLGLVFVQELAFGVGDLTAGKHAVTTTKRSCFKTSSSVGHTTPIHFQFRSDSATHVPVPVLTPIRVCFLVIFVLIIVVVVCVKSHKAVLLFVVWRLNYLQTKDTSC